MQRLKNSLTDFKKKFCFRRVNLSQISETIKFIKKNSKVSLSKKFYLAQYSKNNQLSSFICELKKTKEIIGHVGFVKYLKKDNKHYVYSRHSSIINIKFRNQKIYSNLVEFSLKNLKVDDSVLLWPNKNNKKSRINSFFGKYNYNISNHFLFFKSNSENKLKRLNKFNILKKYIIINSYKNIIYKNLIYFKKRYFRKDKSLYFYHEYQDSSIAIFTDDKNNKKKILLDMIGDITKKKEHLKYLTTILSFYCCIDNKKIDMLSKIITMSFTGKVFNMIFITNKKINLMNYDINLGDTDSFLQTNI